MTVSFEEELKGSFLLFTETFFPFVTGRKFILSNPDGRESHFITVARALTQVKRQELLHLLINMPPGYGKSALICMWIPWCFASYPDCKFIYTSYSHDLAAKHTEFIRRVMSTPEYIDTFGVELSKSSRARDYFVTTDGGEVAAFGAAGAITGRDAGLPGMGRFSGAVIMDDPLKPDEAHSDTIRAKVKSNFQETIIARLRDPSVPIVSICQRLHEDDLAAFMLSDKCEKKFTHVNLKALDDAGNALYPEVNPKADLLEKKEKSPYVYAGQYQQEPTPAGGAIFKPEYFIELEDEPEIIQTFITVDSAETSKTHNDATAMMFLGLYEIKQGEFETGLYALHVLDVLETWVEPKDLKTTFLDFYTTCMRHPVKPTTAVIEKKSTGVTLISVLQDMRGLEIRDVQRTKASGSKAERYLEMQPVAASKRITLPWGARFNKIFIEHMRKITANDTHRRDDICDCLYDGVKIALLDGVLYQAPTKNKSDLSKKLLSGFNAQQQQRDRLYYGQGS